MSQHINLLPRPTAARPSLENAIRWLFGPLFLGLLLGVGIWGWQSNELDQLEVRQRTQLQELQQLRQTLSTRRQSQDMNSSASRPGNSAEESARSAQALVKRLDALGDRQGFSRHLVLLARNKPAGVWLTDFDIRLHPASLSVQGKTRNLPELLSYQRQLKSGFMDLGTVLESLDIVPDAGSGRDKLLDFKIY